MDRSCCVLQDAVTAVWDTVLVVEMDMSMTRTLHNAIDVLLAAQLAVLLIPVLAQLAMMDTSYQERHVKLVTPPVSLVQELPRAARTAFPDNSTTELPVLHVHETVSAA
jgi:hypothetical protein